MNGFVVFFIIVFVVIPVIKNIAKAKPANKPGNAANPGAPKPATQNWAEVQKLLQQKINSGVSNTRNNTRGAQNRPSQKRDSRGHSDARKNSHQRLHSQDGNKNVFTESHQGRVNKRDQRDRSERNRIEAMLHSKTNRSIVRDSNNSIDGWGERGEKTSGYGFLFLILFGLIALLVISKVEPRLIPELLEKLNIK